MSWRWLVDVRGSKPKVDWRRLVIVVVLAEVILGPVAWLLAERVGPLAMLVVLLPIGSILIAVDVQMRRHDDEAAP